MRTCFVFPGQGAQYAGMGRDLWDYSAQVKDIVHRASDCTGIDLKHALFNATDEELKNTNLAQVAITTVNIAAAAVLNENGIQCDGAAGFSVGEYSALYVSGVLDFETLYALIKARGDAMAAASEALRSEAGPPGMAAVIGLDYDRVAELCAKQLHNVYIANYNSPTQIVIASTAEGLAAAEGVLKGAGAKRIIPLRVSGPFHTPLIEGARTQFGRAIEPYVFQDPKLPVYSNVTGAVVRSGAEAKDLCVRQVVTAVRWVDDERSILADGFERVVEAGPGRVLTGLWKSVGGEIPCLPAGTVEQIKGLG
ncbi:MAG TPA: ACP S-malonyltransferase [Spirochaetia bacterium]|nr:ACP S-malonyltransferase [Spirochaetia bacterium]